MYDSVESVPNSLSQIKISHLENLKPQPTGKPAILRTQERTGDNFESVKEYRPNGYLVGVGMGALLSLVEAFPSETPPKGIIISDINPHVIAAARLFGQELAQSGNFDELYQRYFALDPQTYGSRIHEIISADLELQKAISPDEQIPYTPMQAWQDDLEETDLQAIRPIQSVKKHFTLLHQLAHEGKISVYFKSILEPKFIDDLRDRSEWTTSRNIIYLSNLIDFLPQEQDNPLLDNLSKIEDNSLFIQPGESATLIPRQTVEEVISGHRQFKSSIPINNFS